MLLKSVYVLKRLIHTGSIIICGNLTQRTTLSSIGSRILDVLSVFNFYRPTFTDLSPG